ncbi:MAG TPA: branched-chain amino acid ABC transporter substrate-binding protein [Candidatus Dormibacteraeota bacterium]|nr:branched-chain amino acid ABC transporter substrate-binding protein [Candidatus Dormibacteraeota bacterium]
MRFLLQATALAGALAVTSVACSSGGVVLTAANTIKIGVDLPLSGDEGQAGTPALNGVRYFVRQHPTLDGFKIVVSARDDAYYGVHDADIGAGNVQTFITDRQVLGMIGPFDSSVARAQIPIANQAHLAMVSPATSSRCLTKEPFLPAALTPTRADVSCKTAGLPSPKDLRPTGINNYFRLATTDELQGPAAADYGYRYLHLLRVAVLSDHEAYGQALANSFVERFLHLGGSVVSQLDFVPSAQVDLKPFMQQAKREGAQAIYFGGTTANQGCVIRAQMQSVFDAGEGTPYLGGDGIAEDPACLRDARTNAAGIYATVPAPTPERLAGAQSVIAAFKAAYPNPADYGAYTIAGYDAAGVLYDALDRAIKASGGKLPVRDTVVAALGVTTAFQGAMGTFGFDPAGDITLRILSIFEATGTDPQTPWTWVHAVDYSAALPY